MTDESNNPQHIINKLKLDPPVKPLREKDCPACGARRAKQPGLTHCAYCGHEFNSISPGEERAR